MSKIAELKLIFWQINNSCKFCIYGMPPVCWAKSVNLTSCQISSFGLRIAFPLASSLFKFSAPAISKSKNAILKFLFIFNS